MQDILNKVNESQRELFLLPTWLTGKLKQSQVRKCRERFESGSLLQIHGETTTLLANRTTKERRDGSWMVIHLQIGNLLAQIRFYGFMGNVGS